MFILPITHDDLRARRWPWVTTALIVACFAVHLAVDTDAGDERVERALRHALEFQAQHPDLDVPAALRPYARNLPKAAPLEVQEVLAELQRDPLGSGAAPVVDEAELAADREELERRAKEVQEALDEHPVRQLGFVPAAPRASSLFTHQFMHGGWLHLVSNLWFLWLCGCNLEDRWGRFAFGAFYLLAGAAAAATHLTFALASNLALIGASGSVAGAMGAFMVVHARTRIRFVYLWPFALRFGTFRAPAYVMLPLWAFAEFFNATLLPEAGVAHWAHVGGFAFGLPAALLLRVTGIEARLDRAVDDAVTTNQDPRILAAAAQIDERRFDLAFPALEALAREQPRNLDVQLALLRGARDAGDRERTVAAYDCLVRLYFEEGARGPAIALWKEVVEQALPSQLARQYRLEAGLGLAEQKAFGEAGLTFQSLYAKGLSDRLAVRAAVENAAVALEAGRPDAALRILRAVEASPLRDAALSARCAALRSRIGGA